MNRAIAVLPALVPIPMPVGLMPGMKIPRIPFPLYLWRVTVWTVPPCSRWAGSFTGRGECGCPRGQPKKSLAGLFVQAAWCFGVTRRVCSPVEWGKILA